MLRLALSFLTCTSALAAEAPPWQVHLAKQQQALEIRDGRLAGPGAAALLAAAGDAQFVLVGEDHGFAEVPEFAAALLRTLGDAAPRHHVIEVGPHSAARIEKALEDGREGLLALNHDYPAALPFLALVEDGDLAAQVADGGGDIVGIDQEFVLAPLMHLDGLLADAPDASTRAALEQAIERVAAANKKLIDEHDPAQMPLLALEPIEWRELRDRYPSASAGWQLLEDLAASTDIYLQQNNAPYASNLARSRMMKRQFMAWYRGAGPRPRALFKFGAYHAGRGHSPVGLYDIGNLAGELAESEGSRSLHILVLMAGGTVNRWLPFLPDQSARAQTYDASETASTLGAADFLPLAQAHAWSIVDTESLRGRRWPEGTPTNLRELVNHWDRVVLVREGRAARM